MTISKPLRYSAQEIAAKIATDDRWLYRALTRIYENQTADEQNAETTKEQNGIGFNAVDAPLLSSIAKQLVVKGWISAKQRELAREKLRKYSGQLARVAKDKAQ